MSETGDTTDDLDQPVQDQGGRTDASELSDEGVGATMSDEPNTMEPEEGLPEAD